MFLGIKIAGGTEKISFSDLNTIKPIIVNTKSLHNNEGLVLHGFKERPFIYVENNEFISNVNNGIVIQNWDCVDGAHSQIYLSQCNFSNNKGSGLASSSAFKLSILIDKSTFSRNGKNGIEIIMVHAYFPHNVDISNSEVMSNNYQGIYFAFTCSSCSFDISQHVVGNVIGGNGWRQVLSSISSYSQYASQNIFLVMLNNI